MSLACLPRSRVRFDPARRPSLRGAGPQRPRRTNVADGSGRAGCGRRAERRRRASRRPHGRAGARRSWTIRSRARGARRWRSCRAPARGRHRAIAGPVDYGLARRGRRGGDVGAPTDQSLPAAAIAAHELNY
jgi:hypothetical protein